MCTSYAKIDPKLKQLCNRYINTDALKTNSNYKSGQIILESNLPSLTIFDGNLGVSRIDNHLRKIYPF